MTKEHFEMVKALTGVYGQWAHVRAVSEVKCLAEFKPLGLKHIYVWGFHVRKAGYFDMINTSTGIVDLGIEVKAKRGSYYEDEPNGIEHFTQQLKSDHEQKYINVRFNEKEVDENGKLTNVKMDVYIDKDFKIIPDISVYMGKSTKSARTEFIEGTAKVFTRQIKIENIVRLAIGGNEFVDESLVQYLDLDETLFTKNI